MRSPIMSKSPKRKVKKPVSKQSLMPKPAKKKSLKRWNAIIEHIGKSKGLVGAEIGVDTGKTCKYLFEHVPGIMLYMVDRWIATPPGDSYFQGAKKLCHEPQSYFDRAYKKVMDIAHGYSHKILKMDSVEASHFVEDHYLDFCFIDGDHSYIGTKRDIEAWLPKVKLGGWICGHDYDNQNTIGDVKTAVDEAFGKDIELSYNTTWFYQVKESDIKKHKVEPEIEDDFAPVAEPINGEWV